MILQIAQYLVLLNITIFKGVFYYHTISILKEQAFYGHEHTRRNGQILKTMGQFSEKIGTKWTALICQRTGLIRALVPVRWQIKPVCQPYLSHQ